MVDYARNFKRKMAILGETSYDRNMTRKAHEFNRYFANTLNKEDCTIDGRPEKAVFQDHSQSNNKDLSDDKYLIAPNNVEVNIGSYLKWRDSEWLVFTEEYKTIPTHQQLKIKRVNKRLKWIVDYKNHAICNNGEGWGAYVQNQTLYTLGVSFSGNYNSLINAKMMLYLQDNEETRKLGIGDRLFIGNNIYKIEFADNISRVGLINFLLDEDTNNPETDNLELGVADYWQRDNYKSKEESDLEKAKEETVTNTEEPQNEDEPKQDSIVWEIKGSDRARLGRISVYEAVKVNTDGSTEPISVDEWIVSDIEDVPFYIEERDGQKITLRVKDDRRYVGQVANLMAKYNNEIKNLTIKIINKF